MLWPRTRASKSHTSPADANSLPGSQSHRRVALGKPFRELFAQALLDRADLWRVLLLPALQFRRQFDDCRGLDWILDEIFYGSYNARRIEMPLNQQPVGLQAAV